MMMCKQNFFVSILFLFTVISAQGADFFTKYWDKIPVNAEQCRELALSTSDKLVKTTTFKELPGKLFQAEGKLSSNGLCTISITYVANKALPNPISTDWVLYSSSEGEIDPKDDPWAYANQLDCEKDLSKQIITFEEETGLHAVIAYCHSYLYEASLKKNTAWSLRIQSYGKPIKSPENLPVPELSREGHDRFLTNLETTIGKLGGKIFRINRPLGVFKKGEYIHYYSLPWSQTNRDIHWFELYRPLIQFPLTFETKVQCTTFSKELERLLLSDKAEIIDMDCTDPDEYYGSKLQVAYVETSFVTYPYQNWKTVPNTQYPSLEACISQRPIVLKFFQENISKKAHNAFCSLGWGAPKASPFYEMFIGE